MHFKKILAVFKIASAYAGTIIGAGFASGQELLQFFVVYGATGLWGILLAGILFSLLGYCILELGYRLRATGYHQVLYHVCGRKIAVFFDSLIAVFLFCVLTIMLAGAGTMGEDIFFLPRYYGLAAMALLAAGTAVCGIRGVTFINMCMLPLLALSTLSVGLYSIIYHSITANLLAYSIPVSTYDQPHWILSSILYVSYNLIMGSTVLAPLGPFIPTRQLRFWGSLTGGFFITLLAGFVSFIVMLHYPDILSYEIPMLQISSTQPSINSIAYTCMFLTAMYTTAATTLYACADKLRTATGIGIGKAALLVALASLCFSHFGFSTLISFVFPLVGYLSLYFIVRLCYTGFLSK